MESALKQLSKNFKQLENTEIMIEDLGKDKHKLDTSAKYVVTPASFSYHVVETLNRFDGK